MIQHASLAQDVLDHRLNTRTVYVSAAHMPMLITYLFACSEVDTCPQINPISAFIYWNMHYHIEHHMFPMVPYYNLPELHEILKPQLPKPYRSILEVYREMIPDLIKQGKDPDFYTKRELPPPLPAGEASAAAVGVTPDADGWVAACTRDEVAPGDMLGFVVGPRTYVVYHAEDDGKWYATAGRCTHGAADLVDGLVTGNLIECPKHNGCFDFKTGLAKRLPVKTRLATFPVKILGREVYVNVGGGKHLQVAYDDAKECGVQQGQGSCDIRW